MSPATRECIRAMRIYCADGAKALTPLLDAKKAARSEKEHKQRIEASAARATEQSDARALEVLEMVTRLHWKQARQVWKAYWVPSTIGPDGEPVEV